MKCDETKPECTKCTSTGRKCDGYNKSKSFQSTGEVPKERSTSTHKVLIPGKKTSTTSNSNSSLQSPLNNFLGSPEEQRSLQFFLTRTAPAMGGSFDQSFWLHDLPRMAANEKAIHHTVIALAALNEHHAARGFCAMGSAEQELSLAQYNKAITVLRQPLGSSKATHQTILISCLLFIALEFMRGRPEPGLAHLESGLKIIAQSNKHKRMSTQ